MIMTRLALIVFVTFWVSLAAAQTKSGDRDWQEVINGAKKEGKVVVAGSPDPVMRNDVIPKFTSRCGITVELIPGVRARSRLESRPSGPQESTASTCILPGKTPRPTNYTKTT